ncbi:CHASE domain-containing protein [Phenylobacterium sp.]|uniref:CHASE domain-containing protein n=1 Tax=Phenylobacterium sp. TaxID=1871053 RepID=UPI0025F2360B|nr:CHASE domain-containing protein [Phenylobacterium sp.]
MGLLNWIRHFSVPVLVLLVGACATAFTTVQLLVVAAEQDNARLRLEADLAGSTLQQRLDSSAALLRGAAGLFAASDEVTADEFFAYVDHLRVKSRYPGVLAIGYARRVRGEAGREALVADLRRQGAAGFHVWPEGRRDAYTPVVYLWPRSPANVQVIGYDISVEPKRREALTRALTANDLALSGVVRLARRDTDNTPDGVLMYMPVGDKDPSKAGFVYGALRTDALLETVFPARPDRLVDIVIRDGSPGTGDLLYRTAARDHPRLSTVREVPVAGRRWTIEVNTRPAFEARSNRDLAYWAAALGALFTLALTAAVFAQARAGLRAAEARNALADLNASLEDRVLARTRELAGANAVLREEMVRREAAESQMRQMQKMEAIGQLTGGIAHDFNNMLAIIVGSLDMARRRLTDTDARVARYIDNASEGARRAAALTSRLLVFARRQRLNPEPLDVNRLIEGMTELLSRSLGERIEILTRPADDLWPVHADAAGLENALLNLAVNARDAMPDGGRLVIETENVAGGAPMSGDHVSIRIVDTGSGMPEAVAERAFEPFFTTKEVGKGSGLGLSQVYGFVSQSGGRVTIESGVGHGTTVTIWLPRWRGEAPHAEPADAVADAPRARAGESVLVVEDEAEVRRFSVEALRELGYAVREAAGGAEALRQLADGARTDLLFTDIVMPGMTGPQLAAQARAARPDLKVLYTTGYAREAMDEDGEGEVAGAVLGKPFTVEQLARKVRQALDGEAA